MTKKDMIVELALEEPFLQISEFAERIDTSKKYIRTSLSEAGLSLLELRKEEYNRVVKEEYNRVVKELEELGGN